MTASASALVTSLHARSSELLALDFTPVAVLPDGVALALPGAGEPLPLLLLHEVNASIAANRTTLRIN
jgi:hypothetical protein